MIFLFMMFMQPSHVTLSLVKVLLCNVTGCNVLQEMAEKETQMYMKDNKIRFLEWQMSKSQEDVKKLEETLREKRSEEELRKKRFEMIKENNIKLETKLSYLESICKEKDEELVIIQAQTGNKAEESKKKPQELRVDAEPWFPYKTCNPNIRLVLSV
jgi:DNA repair exonuclease SbcCD ATPase subunit